MRFSCVVQKKVVSLQAFSMVGYIVPARKGIIINHKQLKQWQGQGMSNRNIVFSHFLIKIAKK